MTHAIALTCRLLLPVMLWFAGVAFAQGAYSPESDPDALAMRRILASPEADIDLARVKVEVDRLIDPSVDADAVLAQLDAIADAVRATLPAGASHNATFEALRAYLYGSAPGRKEQPFQYDFSDLYGKNVRNKLLATYLRTRKGNCVSMPLLFLVLAQKLGLDVTAATAPEHVFVMYRDDTGTIHNFEAASGGFKLDATYRRDMPMTQRALDSGIYMRWLTKKEVATVMGVTLLEHYSSQGQDRRRVVLANVLLQHNPRCVDALLHKASAFHRMAMNTYAGRYGSLAEMPPVRERPALPR